MEVILNDNWLEIMNHLTIDLYHLIISCKAMYQLFNANKNNICDFGPYKFTQTQKLMIHDLLNCNIGQQLLIKNPFNRGNKLAILYASVLYKGTTIIFTRHDKLSDWYHLVKILNLNVFVLCKESDKNKLNLLKKNKYNPSIIGCKIIIMPFCFNTFYHTNHSKLINHGTESVTDLISIHRKTNLINQQNVKLYQSEIIPTIHHYNYYCHRDESMGDIYLDSFVIDNRSLSERIKDVYALFINHNYMLVKDFDDIVYTDNDIKYVVNYDYFTMHYTEYLIGKQHIIFLYPGHQDIYKMNEIYNYIKKIALPDIYIHNIHSTVEEKYLNRSVYTNDEYINQFKLLKTPRTKLNYLTLIRQLLVKHEEYRLDQLPHYFFKLLMYVQKKQLNELLSSIDSYIKNL